MRTMGFPEHLISLICKLYGSQKSAVRSGAGITEWFKVGRGVRQGCRKLKLFGHVMRHERFEKGII